MQTNKNVIIIYDYELCVRLIRLPVQTLYLFVQKYAHFTYCYSAFYLYVGCKYIPL
jgi:hypothetical protein